MSKKRSYSTGPYRERACLVGVEIRGGNGLWSLDDSVAELAELADAANANPVATVTQTLNRPAPKYLGTGKIEELKQVIHDERVDVAVFDDELTPTQQLTLENELKVKVIDRTALILDVFARRARTREGQLQIELAQSEYLLPRLAGQWSHLERLGGGIGTRGPGETQIETDRRLVRSRLSRVKREIDKVQRQRAQQRRARSLDNVRNVSLVGYTNAGKSALFNRLTSADVQSRDRLFQTLDTTTRRLFLPSGRGATVSDTVGFIHKLPPLVVASFRATLEEARQADLLLHVVDISSAHAAAQAQVVDEVLGDMGMSETPRILVLNKLDLVSDSPDTGGQAGDGEPFRSVGRDGASLVEQSVVMTSALENWGIDPLRDEIDRVLCQSAEAVMTAAAHSS